MRGLISYLLSKLRFSAKYSFFGRSLGRGHYQLTYQPPEGVYLLNKKIYLTVKPFNSEVKHDVNGKRQTAKIISDFEFCSSMKIKHTKVE